jgi:hypothetical protein
VCMEVYAKCVVDRYRVDHRILCMEVNAKCVVDRYRVAVTLLTVPVRYRSGKNGEAKKTESKSGELSKYIGYHAHIAPCVVCHSVCRGRRKRGKSQRGRSWPKSQRGRSWPKSQRGRSWPTRSGVAAGSNLSGVAAGLLAAGSQLAYMQRGRSWPTRSGPTRSGSQLAYSDPAFVVVAT